MTRLADALTDLPEREAEELWRALRLLQRLSPEARSVAVERLERFVRSESATVDPCSSAPKPR